MKFFSIFASCNKNFRASKDRPTSLWCGECPKCAFVFLLFSAFLEKEDLVGIFGRNLFAEELLLPLFRDLLGFGEMKPFDCVGTFDESRGALVLASKRYGDDCVVRTLLPFVKNPEAILEETFRTSVASTLPSPFRLLGVERIGILGYGKEGVVTEKFLEEKYPQIERMILDQRMDESYLEKQVECDVVIKTPGIPKSKVIVPFVTATNLFFALNKNFTIGVTGSKGKSTTVSLIFEILKTAGKKVRLIGNIGNPMLGVLLEKVDPDEIFVIELSSYMLDDIEYSPNIAVLLNLFPEHMDYHGGIENYYAAKRKIFAFQKEGDIALQPPFSHEEIPLNDNEIPLIGEHNRCNIQIAIKVARLLNVSDEAIRIALRNFKSLPHRLEFVGTFEGIDFYDDAISTTPESTILAIQSLERVDTIFLGGEDRGYDFQELEKVLRQYQVKNIVLFPESGFRILQARENMNVFEAKTMESAVDFAFRCTKKGRICLLSTASPSYSLWKNFEEKGALFQSCVQTHS